MTVQKDDAALLWAAREPSAGQPLSGVRVLEFGTLLPGPMTGLILAEAGATVIKVERPPTGDPMRDYAPQIEGASVHFHALNRGKTSLFADLKTQAGLALVRPLVHSADVLIEPFRPGVMDRLGLGYEQVRATNPRIIYCSLTGWGQTGPKAQTAAHDLNFIAESGHLDRSCGVDGAPVLPPLLTADIAGGVYPAVMNILLAHIDRLRTGRGTHLDIAIFDGMMTFHYDTLIPAVAMDRWPRRGADLVTGGSPRYQVYRTADGRHLAVAAMEDRFWSQFCDMIGLPHCFRGEDCPAGEAIIEVAGRIARRSAGQWMDDAGDRDVCCSIVAGLDEVLADPHVMARGLVEALPGSALPALPLPVARQFRSPAARDPAPKLPDR